MRSMTGFGRAAFQVDELTFDIEVRSVNNRYLDCRVRLPRLLAAFEADLRSRVQQRFDRGKLDLTVTAPGGSMPPPRLEVDMVAAEQYLRAADRLRESERVPGSLEVAGLLALPGVARFVEPEVSAEDARRALFGGLEQALDALEAMRSAEGAALERELVGRLDRVALLIDYLDGRAGTVGEAVRERLRKRAQQLENETGLLDEARLHQEIVLAADRLDITEEIVRLRSHVDQFREIAAAAGPGHPVGRRLDFLLQEFGREANTIGSKGSDAPIAHHIVELKTELERIREQAQNVE